MSELFAFDASGSFDDEGIQQYKWDLDSDGHVEWVDDEITSVKPWKFYEDPGTYQATVIVVDAEGQTDSDTVTFTIQKRDHTDPKAAIDVNGTVETGQQVTMRAADFTEGSDSLAHICWELDGDGTVDGRTWTTTFEETGEREVTLVLKDRGAT